jgi:hypothetical protein
MDPLKIYIYSKVLQQNCVIREVKAGYEMLCADGVRYSPVELAAIYAGDTVRDSYFPERVHTIKKLFNGVIVNIEDAKDS